MHERDSARPAHAGPTAPRAYCTCRSGETLFNLAVDDTPCQPYSLSITPLGIVPFCRCGLGLQLIEEKDRHASSTAALASQLAAAQAEVAKWRVVAEEATSIAEEADRRRTSQVVDVSKDLVKVPSLPCTCPIGSRFGLCVASCPCVFGTSRSCLLFASLLVSSSVGCSVLSTLLE